MSHAATHQLECLENAYAEVLADLGGRGLTQRQLAALLADWSVGAGRRHVRAAFNVVDAAVGFECPTCGAVPGQSCRNPSDDYVLEEFGNPYTSCSPHQARRALTDAPLDVQPEPWGGGILVAISFAGLVAAWLVLRRIVRAER